MKAIALLRRWRNVHATFIKTGKLLQADQESIRAMRLTDFSTPGFPLLGRSIRPEFSLRDDFCLANNGSFGAVPKCVLDAQLGLMKKVQEDPDSWFWYKIKTVYVEAVQHVANFTGCSYDNIVLLENATTGINSILKSFHFNPGDLILMTNHTYGANVAVAKVIADTIPGVGLVILEIPMDTSREQLLNAYFEILEQNPRIRITVIDHITCSSAMLTPIKELVDICHSRDVITIIDGAHSPGQLQLRLDDLGADFFVGNLNKWLFAPIGSALMYVHPNHQHWIRPSVSSFCTFDENLQKRFCPCSTGNYSSLIAVPEAICFYNYLGGSERITEYNSHLNDWAMEMLAAAWKTEPAISQELKAPFMSLIALPSTPEMERYEGHTGRLNLLRELSIRNVKVCLKFDHEKKYLRLSSHVYNYPEEYLVLRDVMGKFLGFL